MGGRREWGDIAASGGGEWRSKSVGAWSTGDVCDWLRAQELSEYAASFSRAGVAGSSLLRFTRADFTSLGLTRVAHRQRLEKQLKSHAAAFS